MWQNKTSNIGSVRRSCQRHGHQTSHQSREPWHRARLQLQDVCDVRRRNPEAARFRLQRRDHESGAGQSLFPNMTNNSSKMEHARLICNVFLKARPGLFWFIFVLFT